MPKYYSPSWLGQLAPGGGVRIKPHTDPEVQEGYMKALDKLVPDREECARLYLELGRYFSCPSNLFLSMQWKTETNLMLSHGGKHMAAWDFCQSWQKKFSHKL